MNELVSVIVPTYNREKFLFDCLASIENQTYENIEIIIVDDGSTDLTLEVVRKFKKLSERKLQYFRFEKNGGIPRALNKGYELANGNFQCQLSSDDLWYDTKIEKQMKIFEKEDSKLGLIFSPYTFCEMDQTRKPLRTWETKKIDNLDRITMFHRLIHDCFMNACTFLMKKDFKKSIGEYPMRPEFEWNQDLWFNFMSVLNTDWKLYCMDEPTAIITIHPDQASKQGKCGLGNEILIPEMIKIATTKGWFHD